MNVRNTVLGFCFIGACVLSGCGTAESDTTEQNDALVSWPVPVRLRLTTIKMNGHSPVNVGIPIHVQVNLPGFTTPSSTYIGDYIGGTAGNLTTQFNCSTEGKLPGSDGYCTANLPVHTTVGPVKFTGTYPTGTNAAPAWVQINSTRTNFTIDSTGHSSVTCGSAWMMLNNSIDGDKITICWQTAVAIPFTTPAILETVFYPAPGEGSSVGLSQSNSISLRQSYSYQSGSGVSLNVNFSIKPFASGTDKKDPNGDLSIAVGSSFGMSGSDTLGASSTITSGNSTGFTYPSTSMFPDPNNNLYEIILAANSAWLDPKDGTPPTITTDLQSGKWVTLTLGQLKGLAQTPPVVSSDIPLGDRQVILDNLKPFLAQQFVAQDPFSSGNVAQFIAANPQRFVPAVPAQMTMRRRPCGTCGDLSTTQTQIKGSGTDTTTGQTTGDSFSFSVVGLGVNASSSTTISTTNSKSVQTTASVTLKTHSLCVEGSVDLYMDQAFGTIVSVPHIEDSCNAPVNCPDGTQAVLQPGQSLSPGQSLHSCNHLWTLTLQPDGMLVETYTDGSIATSFYTPGGTIAVMQSDGNFVVYDASGNPLTDSETYGNPGAYLILQDDGFIDVYKPLANPVGGVGGALPALWAMAPGG